MIKTYFLKNRELKIWMIPMQNEQNDMDQVDSGPVT